MVLPDIVLEGDRPPRAKRQITLDRSDLPRLGARVEECLRYWQIADPNWRPSDDGVAALVRMYGKSLAYRLPLSEVLAEDERRLIELTEQQYQILGLLDRHRQVAISGCAGSGKTILAFEKATRLAESGRRVLLTCFNVGLAGYLRERMTSPDGLQVRHFHGLCTDLIQEAQIRPPAWASGERYLDWLPDGLFEALVQSSRRYDAIIVDEAQDFRASWFDVLETALADGSQSYFYAFFDDNQRLYSTDAIPTWLGEPYQLTVDCRNTDQIGTLVRGLHTGTEFKLSGISGRPVVFMSYVDDADDRRIVLRLDEALGHLRNASVKPEEVVVLGPLRDGPTYRRRDYGPWRLYSSDEPDGNVFFQTIHSFKGQESRVVVLVELERAHAAQSGPTGELDELLYVGCSRATAQLAVVAAESVTRRLSELTATVPKRK